jgi:hypothetical protein
MARVRACQGKYDVEYEIGYPQPGSLRVFRNHL